MVERRICTFCGTDIEPGTGRMYIKKDGVVYNFCTSKCFKNMIVLGRVPRRTTWTRYYEREKGVRMKGQPTEAPAPKARKLKKPAEGEEKAEAKPEAEKKDEAKGKPDEEPKAVEKRPAHKEAPKKEKPVPKTKEGAKKEAKPKPKSEAQAKPAEEAGE